MEFRVICHCDYSYGMELEFSKAMKLGQKYVLLIRKGLEFNHYRKTATHVIEFENLSSLYGVLVDINFDRFY
jgi:hypothetical protein